MRCYFCQQPGADGWVNYQRVAKRDMHKHQEATYPGRVPCHSHCRENYYQARKRRGVKRER